MKNEYAEYLEEVEPYPCSLFNDAGEHTEHTVKTKDDAPESEFDLLKSLLREVGTRPLLSRQEEVELAQHIEEATERLREIRKVFKIQKSRSDNKTGDNAAEGLIQEAEMELREVKHKLIESNLRLVVSIAKRYMGKGLSLSDLIQEGNIGLMTAADKFDYRKGCRFSTYATWWIRQNITRAIANQARTIRLPVHIIAAIHSLYKDSGALRRKLGREPNSEELSERSGLSVSEVCSLMMTLNDPVSLHTPVGEDEGADLEYFIEDRETPSPLEAIASNDLHKQLNSMMDVLTPKEAEVVRKRFGLDNDTPFTLDAIAKEFNVSRERIRQIEAQAIQKMRSLKDSDCLKCFLQNSRACFKGVQA